MTSWEVMKRGEQWGLYIRDYPAQGINPYYNLIKYIDEIFARYLVSEGLAGDLYGQMSEK